jgi:4'-phosphopantetheinyl transferase
MRCDVWWGEVAAYAPWHDSLLDAAERDRRDRYAFPADRARFAVAAALLRLVAGRMTGVAPERVGVGRRCQACGQPHGKPDLGEGAPQVSVSHSGDYVAVAACQDAPVGVDVEHVARRTDYQALVAHVLDPAEAPAATDEAAFLRYWVRKEAVVKATGDGLGAGLRRVTVTPPDQPARLLGYESRPGLRAALSDLAGRPGHPAAVAVLTSSPLEVAEHDAAPLLRAPGVAPGSRPQSPDHDHSAGSQR